MDSNLQGLEIPVIIPAYEPDEKLLTLLEGMKETGFLHIILVDDGSSPACMQYFKEAEEHYQCHILHHAVNQGKGRALKTAFNACLSLYPDCIGAITADSDGQHSPACILKCAQALCEHPNALVLGCRDFNKEDVPAKSEMGNKITRAVMKYLSGISVSDTQTGLRGIPLSFIQELLQVNGERYEFETNMLLETRKQQIPIVEIPIRTIYIEANKSSHFHPVRDSVKIYLIFGKFLFSSLSSSILDLALFTLFCYLLRGRAFPNMTYLTAATIAARILSALYNYGMNYRIVFQSKNGIKNTLPKYVVLAVIQMSLSALLVNLLYPLLGGLELFVKMPVDVFLFFVSYFIQREFVYFERDKGASERRTNKNV